MFDDDSQSVAGVMKPRRKQDTVPSPAAVRPATVRGESDGDRLNRSQTGQPAFISSLRRPATQTGPQCSCRVSVLCCSVQAKSNYFALLVDCLQTALPRSHLRRTNNPFDRRWLF